MHVGAPELSDLLKELYPAAKKWEDIGIMLKVKDSSLLTIKGDHPSDCSSCLREMLRHWLNNNSQSSWSAVVQALANVEMTELAKTLKTKYASLSQDET